MRSDVPATWCHACGNTFEPTPEEPHRCHCAAPLELTEVPEPPPTDAGPIGGISSIVEHLPPGPLIDLGAGGTPLVTIEEFGATCKLEGCNPTGSFKDRGAAVTIARAVAIGAAQIKEDSSGNAGLAIAAHGARAGLSADIYVPSTAAGSTVTAIKSTGANVVPIDGSRDAVASACVNADAGWYASHAWRPEFYEGTATLAYELVADLGGRPPPAVVLPVGHGTLLLGLYRGFDRLVQAGRIDTIPPLFAGQLRGAGSLLEGDATVEPTLAPGIRISRPARHDQVHAAIEASGGQVVPVAPEHVKTAQRRLQTRGFNVCTTASVALATLDTLRDEDLIESATIPTIVLTGRARNG